MKGITLGDGLNPIPYGGFYEPETDIPVSVGVGVGVTGASVGWSKDIAEIEVKVDWAD